MSLLTSVLSTRKDMILSDNCNSNFYVNAANWYWWYLIYHNCTIFPKVTSHGMGHNQVWVRMAGKTLATTGL